jgi:crotonobetainyl-CoA:carnitine CoA-transferase CaiB-like acyl-CoA transferase
MGPHFQGEQSLYFLALNSGKRSIGVRLATDQGRAVVEDLVRGADVVIDNYRPGVLAKFGLGHDALRTANPAIVTCSLTGYGETGPDATRAGYDYTIQALAGVMSLAGEPHGPPTKAGISYVDHSGGITAALGVCAALVERSRTGLGSHVDLALFDVQISMLTYLASWQRNRAAEFERTANSAHPTLVPAQNFRTADGHLALFIGNDGMWRRFVDAIDDATLSEARFVTREGRLEHRDEVIDCVQRVLLGATSREWEARLGESGVACGAVNSVAEALAEPQTEARGLLVQNEHPAYGRYEHLRGPLPTRGRDTLRPAPVLGEHTLEALTGIGYTSASITALRAAGIVS